MTLLVDTSVWSLALRRDTPPNNPEVEALRRALAGAELVATTGLILQELLQGFTPVGVRAQIIEHFAALRLLQPDRDDHVAAADLKNTCRRAGVQIGTIDALIAQVAIRYDLTLLTTDQDFLHAARHCPLRLWSVTTHQ
ncbi:MAG: PIN domain-containing protein [Micrococcales bacterium]|nr:PIN domain-containing protein [Micrococcales bacterium]